MSPEEQRIAIAKACGLKIHSSALQVPDYLNDLNAMHSVEEALDDQQKEDFVVYLANAAQFKRRTNRDLHSDYWCVVHATAAQRAEAFLRVKGLWKD